MAPSDAPELRPASSSERVLFLDVLRGFALCGVFLSNVYMHFGGRYPPPKDGPAPWLGSPVDGAIHPLYEFLLAGKAMTLFSFLFGLGFALQLGRARARGANVLPLYARRLTVLLLLGVFHIFALWYGDVLAMYALVGFLLLLFQHVPDTRLSVWGVTLVLGAPLVFAALQRFVPLLASSPEVVQATVQQERAQGEAFRSQILATLTHGSFLEALRANASLYLSRLFRAQFLSFLLICLGRFLLGFAVGQRRLLEDPERHRPLLRRLLGWGLLAGVVGNSLPFLVEALSQAWNIPKGSPGLFFMPMVSELGSLGLATFYMAGLALLFQRPRWRTGLSVLAPAGQMALTNYLSQTVLALVLFRGYALNLAGKLGALACFTLIFGLFCLQVLLSHRWLAHFRFGPVEWLWRSLTYGQAQPLRRVSPSPVMAEASRL